MDFDLKLKALSRLAHSSTKAAEIALQRNSKRSGILRRRYQYDHLAQHLEVLDTIGHRFSTML